jgi:hypothetical protein
MGTMDIKYALRRVFEPETLRVAAVSGAAMLLSYGSALWLEHVAGLNLDVIMLAVVLSLTLGRTQRGAGPRTRLVGLVALAVLAVAAGEVGQVMQHHRQLGDTLFTLGLGLAIWIRRFGPLATRIGTLLSMPFIGVLVSPLPLPPGAGSPLWGAAAAAIAFGWVAVLQEAADRTGFTTPLPPPPPPEPARPTKSRVLPSTRMGLQMAAAVGAAFVVGREQFPHHWTWPVLTAFLVCSGTRGRADVAYKGLLRVVGAAAGTVAATALAGSFGPGDKTSVAVMLAILVVAAWLRTFSYAYWAGCVTAVLALLYGYFGQTGDDLLRERLGGIAIGAAIAVAASWLILPINSSQVLRRRAAIVLSVLTDLLAAVREEPGRIEHHRSRFRQALGQVDEVARPLELHRRLVARRRPEAVHPADAVDTIHRSAAAVARLGRDESAVTDLTGARADLARILIATRPPG